MVYLIDASSRKIKAGRQIIHFKHTGALLGTGKPEGVALEATRQMRGPRSRVGGSVRRSATAAQLYSVCPFFRAK